ncbi:MAG: hypothetical protein Hens3KO_03720 [Henriciella sp.]
MDEFLFLKVPKRTDETAFNSGQRSDDRYQNQRDQERVADKGRKVCLRNVEREKHQERTQ